ncbi:hypothetical protein Ancab_036957 [Ancistrocladus abbreviatus]
MSLGSLLLEGDSYEFWVALGCLSGHKALKYRAFSRGLQFDVSLAIAWACLGKRLAFRGTENEPCFYKLLYRELGDKQLARLAFDRAKSIDPSLALPWAGMSADVPTRESVSDEAYESCLRAVQIMPVKQGSEDLIDTQSGVGHLKKALHMYLNSTSIRYINFVSGLLETILRLAFCLMISVSNTKDASKLLLLDGYMFFAHLQLCRVHPATDNYINSKEEYMRCLNLQTNYPVGWMCLKFIESRYDLQDEVNSFYEGFRGDVNGSEGSQNMWMAVYNLLLGLIFAWAQDLVHVE